MHFAESTSYCESTTSRHPQLPGEVHGTCTSSVRTSIIQMSGAGTRKPGIDFWCCPSLALRGRQTSSLGDRASSLPRERPVCHETHSGKKWPLETQSRLHDWPARRGGRFSGSRHGSEGTFLSLPSRFPDLAGVWIRTLACVYRITKGQKAQGPGLGLAEGTERGGQQAPQTLTQKEPLCRAVGLCVGLCHPSCRLGTGLLRRYRGVGDGAETHTEHRGDPLRGNLRPRLGRVG